MTLVERHRDGRPDMIGMEAVNQLLVTLEVHRFDFCFVGTQDIVAAVVDACAEKHVPIQL